MIYLILIPKLYKPENKKNKKRFFQLKKMDDWEALADADIEQIEIKKETINSKFEEEERLEKLAKEAIEAEKKEEEAENQPETKDQPKKEKKQIKEVDTKGIDKTITIVDPFGVPDRKAAKPTADEKKRAEQYLYLYF